jgi:hypothetical protein
LRYVAWHGMAGKKREVVDAITYVSLQMYVRMANKQTG